VWGRTGRSLGQGAMTDAAGKSLVGRQLGSYHILSLLGAGGMGEVYRARDLRLGREVAVKILPAAFSRDEDRLRRFQQEARATGQLNHPNIIAVHDVGAHDGSPYLVSELLEGQTLRQRIAGRRLPARLAIEYGTQMAQGLAAAHEKGIVHRDLKPENVFVTKDGHVKILDFGLAKLIGEHAGNDATVTGEGTQPGAVLGTPGYMSPEQARGFTADYRTDIFSLGTLLYEMLTGQAPFRRGTAADTISAVLHDEPPEFSGAVSVPPALDRIVLHCLEKDPGARFQSARDLAFALDALLPLARSSPPPGVRGPGQGIRAGLAGLALVAATGIGVLLGLRAAPEEPAHDARVIRLTDLAGLEEFPAISPDGRAVAFTAGVGGTRQIFVRLIAGGAPLQITRGPIDHQFPRWSPDSSSIVYFSPAARGEMQGAIWELSALGGVPRRVTASLGGGADVSFVDGRLAFFRLAEARIQLVTAPADASEAEVLAQFAPEMYYLHPRWSPDGRWIAFQRGDGIRFDLFVVPASGGQLRQVTDDNSTISGFAWRPDSTGIIYSSSRGSTMPYLPTSSLWQVRLQDGTVRPVRSGENSYVHPDIAGNGPVVFGRMRMATDIWKFPVAGPPDENVRRGIRVTHQTGQVLTPTAGPGDREVAFLSDSGGRANVWVIDVESGDLRQITYERDPDVSIGLPVWSPDGSSIAFLSTRGNPGLTFGIWLVNPDGSNLRSLVNPGLGPAWSVDGRWLYYSTRAGPAPADVVMKKIPAEGGTAVDVTAERLRNVIGSDGDTVYYTFERPLVDGSPEFEIRGVRAGNAPFRVLARIPASRVPMWQIVNPALSPDGQWLAQALTDGFTTNIWALSTSTGEWRQITDFGHRPTFIARRVSWSSDGRYILAAVGEGDADIVLLDASLP
jgi:eukaryotic-like serine/threonine-protein kinase